MGVEVVVIGCRSCNLRHTSCATPCSRRGVHPDLVQELLVTLTALRPSTVVPRHRLDGGKDRLGDGGGGLALDERYVEGFVEVCLGRIGEGDPDEEGFRRGVWEDGHDGEFVLETLEGGVEVRSGRP